MPYGGRIKWEHLPPIQTKNVPMIQLEKDLFVGKFNKNTLGYLFTNERALNTVYVPSLDYEYYMLQIADEDIDVIVHYAQQGDFVHQGSRYGMIRYGSQVDLILPLPAPFEYELLVPDFYHVEAGDPLIKIKRDTIHGKDLTEE